MLEGKSGVGPVTRFNAEAYSTRIVGEVKNFDPLQYLDAKELRRTDLAQQYAIAASQMALDDSGMDLEKVDHDQVGVVIGSGVGGISTFEDQHERLLKSGPGRVSPFFIRKAPAACSLRFASRLHKQPGDSLRWRPSSQWNT